jgi:hypothetical protein
MGKPPKLPPPPIDDFEDVTHVGDDEFSSESPSVPHGSTAALTPEEIADRRDRSNLALQINECTRQIEFLRLEVGSLQARANELAAQMAGHRVALAEVRSTLKELRDRLRVVVEQLEALLTP